MQLARFDEGLEVCEDYDLWLRIAARHPIHFIEKPLIVKRGGHGDQLSKKLNGQDRFRIKALTNLLTEDYISPRQRELAWRELAKKCAIYGKGCIKRGKQRRGREGTGSRSQVRPRLRRPGR